MEPPLGQNLQTNWDKEKLFQKVNPDSVPYLL